MVAKTKLITSPASPMRYPFSRPYIVMARAKGNGAKTDMMKLIHKITDDSPKKNNLPVDSCGVCITSVFIPVYNPD